MLSTQPQKILTQTKPENPTILYLKLHSAEGSKRPCSPRFRPGHRFSHYENGDRKKSFIDVTVDMITAKSSKDLILGTITGWVAGMSLVKVGKIAAFGLGGGIILLHFASEGGYISINWDRVREAAKQSQILIDNTFRFVKKNSYYSVGLLGGFFFGVASS